MAKKSFKKTGGYGTEMYQGKKEIETNQEPKNRKQKVSAKGFIRHSLMIRPEHLEELREISKLAKKDIQDILSKALGDYFKESWPDDKREMLRAKREKEAQEIEQDWL